MKHYFLSGWIIFILATPLFSIDFPGLNGFTFNANINTINDALTQYNIPTINVNSSKKKAYLIKVKSDVSGKEKLKNTHITYFDYFNVTKLRILKSEDSFKGLEVFLMDSYKKDDEETIKKILFEIEKITNSLKKDYHVEEFDYKHIRSELNRDTLNTIGYKKVLLLKHNQSDIIGSLYIQTTQWKKFQRLHIRINLIQKDIFKNYVLSSYGQASLRLLPIPLIPFPKHFGFSLVTENSNQTNFYLFTNEANKLYYPNDKIVRRDFGTRKKQPPNLNRQK